MKLYRRPIIIEMPHATTTKSLIPAIALSGAMTVGAIAARALLKGDDRSDSGLVSLYAVTK